VSHVPAGSESKLQADVIEACHVLRLMVYHTHDSRRSAAGFPDLVIVGPGGIEFWELKSAEGKTSIEQREWIDALKRAGQHAAVYRPQDWDLMVGRLRALKA
jgi:hypothetical protein